nr:uncharacterized protein LOC119621835 [Chlorocebus sabaeus]
MAGTQQGAPGGRRWVLVLLMLGYLVPTGGITHLDTRLLLSLVAATEILGGHHVPTSQPSAEDLCPNIPISCGRTPGIRSLSRFRNMSDASLDTKRQPNKRKLIRRAPFSPVPSRSPARSEGPMTSWRLDARGQGWDPGGPRTPVYPVPSEQSHPAHSGLQHRPRSPTRTGDRLPFDAVVSAQTTDQGTPGTTTQLTRDHSSPASLISSVGR